MKEQMKQAWDQTRKGLPTLLVIGLVIMGGIAVVLLLILAVIVLAMWSLWTLIATIPLAFVLGTLNLGMCVTILERRCW